MVWVVVIASGCSSQPAHPSHPHSQAQSTHGGAVARSKASPHDYIVQPGDTLYAIAFRAQVDYHDLANWNGIGRNYAIYPGMRLHLSAPGTAALPSVGVASENPAAGAATANTQPPPRNISDAGGPASAIPVQAMPPGAWQWPLVGLVQRSFAPDNGCKGIDIAGTLGQVVVAAAAGKVVYSGAALKGYGELIIVKHNEDYLSAYGYNSRRLVEEGAMVAAGQPIAEVGAAPGQKPALHFEIRIKGVPIDPAQSLPSR